MEKKSKRELIEIIAQQDDHCAKVEKRLRDVVHAYKSLVKEKEALEATVKAFSLSPRQLGNGAKKTAKKGTHKSPEVEEGASVAGDPLGVADTPADDVGDNKEEVPEATEEDDGHCTNESCQDRENAFEQLQKQVKTLSASLATVTEQKSKMEAAYQADKKSVMQEHEVKIKDANNRVNELEEQYEKSEEQLKQLKTHLRQQQRDWESEQTAHSAMLREIQHLLTVERIEKEELRAQLIEKDKNSQVVSQDRYKQYEEQIKTMSKELDNMSIRLKQSEKASHEPNPLLLQLSKEMSDMKQQHADAITMERKRANDAEEKLQAFSVLEEKRIAELEMKLSELSEIVGNYDRMRQQDQVVILKLKERLAQLDVENATLVRQTSFSTPEPEVEDNRKVTDLQEQVAKLKGILKLNMKRIEKSGGEGQISVSDLDDLLRNDPTHKVCQAEYKQLKDEFELYKLNAKAHMKGESDTSDVQELKEKNIALEKELNELSRYVDEKEKENMQIISRLQCELTNADDKRKNDLNTAYEQYKIQLSGLDAQIKKQRERTEQLLEEKDNDIKRLKERLSFDSPELGSPSKERGITGLHHEQAVVDIPQHEDLAQLFDRQTSGPSEGSLIHYSQMMTKLEEELAGHRKEKYELEFALRDAEHREEHVINQMALLKEEIRKLERDRSRESANMEYLKNVILRYILSDSASVKTQMITAISMVLQLSPTEISEIRKKQTGWWPG